MYICTYLYIYIYLSVTETNAGISADPSVIRIPLSGVPVSAHGRAACHPIARVCVPLDAAVTRVTWTCPARRGCHSCDAISISIFLSIYTRTFVLRGRLPLDLSLDAPLNGRTHLR